MIIQLIIEILKLSKHLQILSFQKFNLNLKLIKITQKRQTDKVRTKQNSNLKNVPKNVVGN
jgi:hypothetical protein